MNDPRSLGLCLLRPVTDIAAFLVAVHLGWFYGLAHLVSFAIAWAVAVLARTVAGGRQGQRGLSTALVGVNLLGLLLRGGVLALLLGRLHVPATVAIAAAVLASTLIVRRGEALCTAAPASGEEGAQWQAIVMALGGFAVLLRLAYMGSVDLFPEEAYYWNYSRHMDYGYLDHPPMVAWLIHAGTVLFGNSEFAIRIAALLCAGIASFFVYRSTRDLYGRRSALVALALMQLLPAYFLAGMFTTPDTPLIAAWAAGLYFLQRALLGGQARAWWGVGVALGLGLVSKYTVALLAPATLVFLLSDRASRAWLARLLPYTAAALALVIFSPVILWNARHDWASFAFQTSQRLAETAHFSLHKLLLSALVLLTPPGFAALPFVLRARQVQLGLPGNDAATRRLRFARIYTLVPLAVFVLFSLRHPVKFDWTGAVWLALVPALAHAIADPAASMLPRWLQRCWGATAVVMLLVYGALLHYLTLGPPGIPYTRQMLVLPVAWRELGSQVDTLAAALQTPQGSPALVVGMNRYMLSSELAFYRHDPVSAAANTASQNLFGLSGLMYEQWFPVAQQQGRTLLLVALDKGELDDARLQPYVQSLGPVQSALLRHNGRVISEFFYREAEGYRAIAGP